MTSELQGWIAAQKFHKPEYTPEEIKAARRFMETCEDGEGYDVPKNMMRRLATLGLVRHIGGGYYEATEQMHNDIVQ